MNEKRNCANRAANVCSGCIRAAAEPVLQEQQKVTRALRLLSDRERLKSEIARKQKAVTLLESEIDQKECHVNKMKTFLYKKHSQLDTAIKRQLQKPKILEMTASDISVANLPLLHPFRQLLSVAKAISDERKTKLEDILHIFPSDCTEPTAINTYTAQILVLISEITCVPLPFPVAFGSMASSPILTIPEAALVSGTYPAPRLLHPSQKRLAILEKHQPLAQKLIIDDVVFLAAVFGVAFATAIDNFTVLTALSSAIRACQFGNPLSQPSMPRTPFESGDDKITDNHGWTLLDSSYDILRSELNSPTI